MHVFKSVQVTHPAEVLHYLHYFKPASKNHPGLQVAHASLVEAHAEQPFVPSKHLYLEADVAVVVVDAVVALVVV